MTAADTIAESDFHRRVDAVLQAIDASLEAADLEAEIVDGILTATCADGSRIVVNRHTPLREIWVAARSGGFHFRFVDGEWHDTRDGETLRARLAAVLHAQAGRVIALTLP